MHDICHPKAGRKKDPRRYGLILVEEGGKGVRTDTGYSEKTI